MAIARRGLPQGKARARRDFRRSADAKRVPHRLVAMSKQDLRAAARSPRSLSGLLPFVRPYRGRIALALVFLVLAGEFASFTIPLLVMLTVPLAAVGGILFLWITGQSLNAVSLIGIVVMIGMADNEAVVKLDAIRRFREAGHSIEEAVMLGGRQRLRAIAMTSITTITGVLPLVFGWGSGGALYQPLAAGVIGGSVSALAVTFFLLPTAYAWMERRKAGR